MKDYYGVLGVPRNATGGQIRARFMEIAKERHPDRYNGADKERAEAEFQELTEAFNVLSNPKRRREVDQGLARGDRGGTTDEVEQSLRLFLQRGIKAYKEKDYFTAAEAFDRATKVDSHSAKAWHHLALACSHQQRWLSRATNAISKACELEPMNVNYLKLAAELFSRAGLTNRSERYLNEARRWGADEAEIERTAARIAASQGRSRRSGS